MIFSRAAAVAALPRRLLALTLGLILIASIGKFGGADQLRNAVNQLQSLLYAA